MKISFLDKKLKNIYLKIINKTRLSTQDGITLFNTFDLTGLGILADIVRKEIHNNKAYYIYNQHLNYTNICKNKCLFCAYGVNKENNKAYSWSINDIKKKLKKRINEPINELHIVGGINTDLDFNYYIDLLKTVKKIRPKAKIKAFTCVEIHNLSKISGFSVEKTICLLKDAGLDMMPGGGAEILNSRIRKKLFPKKIKGETWLKIMEIAHKNGVTSNATMLYGHIETIEEKIAHLISLRELQDKTKGFSAFIPLAFHSKNTSLDYIPLTTSMDDLKNIAIARLMLDNFDHIKAYWVMIGEQLASVALSYGANDLDGTIIEEKITHTAGAKSAKGLTQNQIKDLIKSAGFKPIERDSFYNEIS